MTTQMRTQVIALWHPGGYTNHTRRDKPFVRVNHYRRDDQNSHVILVLCDYLLHCVNQVQNDDLYVRVSHGLNDAQIVDAHQNVVTPSCPCEPCPL